MRKTALITGITGMDGSHAADLLLEQGWKVYGMIRQSASRCLKKIQAAMRHPDFHLVQGDLTEEHSIRMLVRRILPDIILNYGALSFVGESWNQPGLYQDTNAGGVLCLLQAIKEYCPTCRFYQAGSSEQFGEALETPQTEKTPFNPRSPYGVSKVTAHWHIKVFRESFGLFAVTGINLNHESPRRGMQFVTQKICQTAAKIKLGKAKEIRLGNIDAKRDWSFAPDCIRAHLLMLEADEPKDYVIASGETHSVKEWAEIAFAYLELKFDDYYVHDPAFDRPADVNLLLGDASLIKADLGWESTIGFEALVAHMTKEAYTELLGKTDA